MRLREALPFRTSNRRRRSISAANVEGCSKLAFHQTEGVRTDECTAEPECSDLGHGEQQADRATELRLAISTSTDLLPVNLF